MVYDLKIIVCGYKQSIFDIEWCTPLPTKFEDNPEGVSKFIRKQLASVRFILIFLDVFGHTLDSLLSLIGDTTNIIGIYIGDNTIQNLDYNRPNIFRLPRRHITFSITSHAIRACQSASRDLFVPTNTGDAIVWEQKGNDLKRWLTTNNKVEPCDILLIPLYTANDNFLQYQSELIDICTGLCFDYEPRVCTLYDYMCPDECYPNMSNEEKNFINNDNENICLLLTKKLARIRIYVVGNDETNSYKWSLFLLNNELNIASQNPPRFDEQFIYAELEPVTPVIIETLHSYGGRLQEIEKPMLTTLDKIREDSAFFLYAIDRGRVNFEQREMVANIMLSQWTMNYHENSTDYSHEFHTTEQAQNGPVEQDDNLTNEMDRMIQSPAPVSSPN
ncbi:unnamed protein product [Adineta steineri]|uniref:Uncharacterized protein n=1 Tax=Adineta steineri TaxID=433720 RepID=A0A814AFS2_9BILA|nr:unnamed protein product [Adineta steineri]CAF1217224.1 unnamed protein product [Adineta steineri]CAF1323767.1 unnamed protein product [Adineta steineri]